jgi:hemerythrin
MATLIELANAITKKELELKKLKNKRDQEISAIEDELENLWTEHFKQSLIETDGSII